MCDCFLWRVFSLFFVSHRLGIRVNSLQLDIFWANTKLWVFGSPLAFQNFKEALLWILDHAKSPGIFAVTVWGVWSQRNSVRLHKPADALHQILLIAKEMLVEYRAGQVHTTTSFNPSVAQSAKWKAPSSELVKINDDGAVFPNSNLAGVGVVIRDSHGCVLASCSKLIPSAHSGEEIEAQAATVALSFVADIGFSRAVLEGDSWTVFRALQNVDFSLASYGLLVEEAKLEAKKFLQFLYSHMKREGLARSTISISDF